MLITLAVTYMHHDQILRKAELCWREHTVLLLICAAVMDVRAASQEDIDDKTILELSNSIEPLIVILEICKSLLDVRMAYHPNVSGRKDIVIKAHQFIFQYSNLYPLTTLELARYFHSDENLAIPLVKNAIKAHPYLLKLYYTYMDLQPSPWKRLGTLVKLHNRGITWDSNLPVMYTPLLDMAIGHMGSFIDTRNYILDKRKRARCTKSSDIWIDSNYSACNTLKSFLEISYNKVDFASIVHINLNDSLVLPVSVLINVYRSNPQSQFFRISERVRKFNAMGGISPQRCIIHLRTGNFKYNDQNLGMGDRSVDPKTYQKMCHWLGSTGIEIIHITADSPPITIDSEIPVLWVNGIPSMNHQWRTYSKADFVIGTQSGISHLIGLSKYGGYLTNYSLIPIEMDLNGATMLHCKRIIPRETVLAYTKKQRFAMYLYPWNLGSECLAKHVDIRHLTAEELSVGITEYLDLLISDSRPWTLYKLLKDHGLFDVSICLPDVSLAQSTYDDLSLLLGCQ